MQVRAAGPGDYETWLDFVTYLSISGTPSSRERYETGIMPNALFVEADGQVVGYALSFAFGTRGDVRQIAVAPTARKRGVGGILMAAVREKLVQRGCTDWRLEVLAENTPAIALYRASGMRELWVTHELRIPPDVRKSIARPVLDLEPVTPDDDDALETAFDLGRGQIQRWRSFRPNARLVTIEHRAFAQIIDDYADDHGLIFPLYATDNDCLRSIIATTFDKTYEVVVTDDRMLVAAGAERLRDALIFGGSLRDR
ncbi:MAG: GNAT family N-acetyltransferase [Kofleriaceae bacterium]